MRIYIEIDMHILKRPKQEWGAYRCKHQTNWQNTYYSRHIDS